MSVQSRLLGATVLAVLALFIAVPLVALAHERREVGKYDLVVGWTGEPAFASQKNGLDLTVTNRETQQPVEGLEKTLKAEVIFGGQKREFELRAVFRQPGKYTADIVPTKEGDYRFRFFGTVEGAAVNETFDSADGKFNGVRSIQAIYFPEAELSTSQISQEAREAHAKADAAQSALVTNQTLAIAALGLAGLGVVLSGLVMVTSRRRAAALGEPSVLT